MIWWETTSFPGGTWHKGALTTVLMKFAEARFQAETFPNEPLLGLAAEACEGFKFLRRYSQMASVLPLGASGGLKVVPR